MNYFYMQADEKEIQFYKQFDVKPITHISECAFHNLDLIGLEIGDDVCEKAEEDYYGAEPEGCGDCPKRKENIEWYPPIQDHVLVSLLLVCGTDGFDGGYEYSQELVDKILDYAFILSLNKEVKEKIHNMLEAYLESYWRR